VSGPKRGLPTKAEADQSSIWLFKAQREQNKNTDSHNKFNLCHRARTLATRCLRHSSVRVRSKQCVQHAEKRISNSLISMTSSAHAIITHAARLRLPLPISKQRYAALSQVTHSNLPTSPPKMTSQSNTTSEPLFFWREFEEPYGFLSQWYDSPFEVEGVTYASTEMWMMIQKAKLFGDEVCAVATLDGEKPKENMNI